MTAPSADTLKREKDKLYVTDAELIRRLGVPEPVGRDALQMLDRFHAKSFPQKQKLWGDRRYWPHVKKWFDENGSKLQGGAPRPIPERPDRTGLARRPFPAERPAEARNVRPITT